MGGFDAPPAPPAGIFRGTWMADTEYKANDTWTAPDGTLRYYPADTTSPSSYVVGASLPATENTGFTVNNTPATSTDVLQLVTTNPPVARWVTPPANSIYDGDTGTIIHRRDTAAEWATANPVLASGEPAYETDTGREKIGDGSTTYNLLNYTPSREEVDLLNEGKADRADLAAAIAANPTVAGAAAAAVASTIAGLDLLQAGSVDAPNISFALVDSTGRLSSLAIGTDGRFTPAAAALIAEVVSASVGVLLGFDAAPANSAASGVAFGVVDSAGRISWLETATNGRPTDRAAALIAQAVSAGLGLDPAPVPADASGVAFGVVDAQGRQSAFMLGPDGRPTAQAGALLGQSIGVEVASFAAATGVAWAVVGSDGAISDLAIGPDGHFLPATMARLAASVGVGTGTVTLASLSPEVLARLVPASTPTYTPELTGGKLLVNAGLTGKRVLITDSGSPANPRITRDNWVTYDTSIVPMACPVDGGTPVRQFPLAEMADYGDSYTASTPGPWPAQNAITLGIPVNNRGVGGQSSADVAIRQGGLQPLLTVAGNQIPASGAVTVTARTPATGYRNDGSSIFTWNGTLAGVPGTLTHDIGAGTWTFTRTSSGSVVACPAGTPFIPTPVDANDLDRAQTLWVGRNNIGHPADSDPVIDVPRDVASMVAKLRPYTKRYAVVATMNVPGEHSGSSAYTSIVATNQALAAAYDQRFLDIRRLFIDQSLAFLIANGLTPTSDDLADVAADAPPRQLYGVDVFHPTALGYQLIASIIATYWTQRGLIL